MYIIPISQVGPQGSSVFSEPKTQAQNVPFADILGQAMQHFRETQEVSQQDAYKLAVGTADDLHTITINSAKATAALELTVEVASRAVSAYKEILQMQI